MTLQQRLSLSSTFLCYPWCTAAVHAQQVIVSVSQHRYCRTITHHTRSVNCGLTPVQLNKMQRLKQARFMFRCNIFFVSCWKGPPPKWCHLLTRCAKPTWLGTHNVQPCIKVKTVHYISVTVSSEMEWKRCVKNRSNFHVLFAKNLIDVVLNLIWNSSYSMWHDAIGQQTDLYHPWHLFFRENNHIALKNCKICTCAFFRARQ